MIILHVYHQEDFHLLLHILIHILGGILILDMNHIHMDIILHILLPLIIEDIVLLLLLLGEEGDHHLLDIVLIVGGIDIIVLPRGIVGKVVRIGEKTNIQKKVTREEKN